MKVRVCMALIKCEEYRKEAKLIVNEYLNGNADNNYAYKKW